LAIDVVTGAANTGKTGVVYARIREHCRSGGAAVLLLPSAPDVSRAARDLAAEVPLGLHIETFDGLLDRMWKLHGDGRVLIQRTQRLLLLEDIVSHATLTELTTSARTVGFLTTLAHAAERAAEAPPLSQYDQTPAVGAGPEVLALLAAYQSALRTMGKVERGEAHRLLAARAAELDLPGLIVAHRFTGFTGAQEAFLVARARCADVLATLTYDESVPATGAAQPLVARLRSAGRIDHQVHGKVYSSSDELVRIERALAGGSADVVAAAGAVVLSEAVGEAAEAARIAREVQDALDAGFAAGRIAVAFRDPASHLPSLRAAFDEVGIAAEWDVRVSFSQTGLGRALLLLLAVQAGSGSRADLLDVLRSPYSPATDDQVDELDVRLRRNRTADLVSARRACRSLGTKVTAFLEAADVACAARDEEVLVVWHGLTATMLGSARPGAPVLDVDGLLDAAAQRAFLNVLAEGVEGAIAPLSSQRLAAALRESTVTVGSSDSSDCVQVMGADRLRGRRFACVILGGLTAAEFPRPVREDALSAWRVADALGAAGIDVAPRSTLADERLLFYQVVTRAADRLVLSRQTHDAEGRVLAPSVFLEELLDLYRDPATGVWYDGEPPRRALSADGFADGPDAPRTRRRFLRAQARCVGAGEPPASDPPADARLALARYRARSRPACLGARAVAELASREVFSASELELYLQCPFRWYVERVIRPVGLDIEVDAARSGLLAHEIMRRFYDELLVRSSEQRVTPGTLPAALSTLRYIAADRAEAVTAIGLTEAVGVRQVVLGTEGLVSADATLLPGMVPAHREWSFGLGEGDPPEEFEGFSLAGRIDRIDADETTVVVTDYKLGTVDTNRAWAAFEREGLVQLPLYAAVASRRLGLEVAGGLYRSVRHGRARGFVRDDHASDQFTRTDIRSRAQIEVLIEEALARARTAVDGIRQGRIAARSRDRRCPSYCAARAICRSRGASDG